MKRFLLWLLGSLLCFTAITGCGSNGAVNPAGAPTSPSNTPTPLETNDPLSENTFFDLLDQGNLATSEGRHQDALSLYEQALQQATERNDQLGISTVHRRIGIIHHTTDNYPLAIEHYEQAVSTAQAIHASALEGNALRNLGIVHFDQDDYQTALTYYAQALAASRQPDAQEKDPLLEADVLQSIGKAQHLQGELILALQNYNAALTIYNTLGNIPLQATTLRNIGKVYQEQGDNELALQNYNTALAIAGELNEEQLEQELQGLIGSLNGE